MIRLLLATAVFGPSLFAHPAAAQHSAKRPTPTPVSHPTTNRPVVTTPLAWAAQQRRAVPPTASFHCEVTYFDATDQPIADTLLALTDTKWVQCVRRDNATQAPVGLVRQVYWPSLRPMGEGRLGIVAGEELPVGPWVYWYDHAPRETNKRLQATYDAQGQLLAGTVQQ